MFSISALWNHIVHKTEMSDFVYICVTSTSTIILKKGGSL